MRLHPSEIKLLITSVERFLKNNEAELRLYGSRVKDNLKGGDIDLLLIAEKEQVTTQLMNEKHRLLADIKKYLGDQKIDLLIVTRNELNEDPFLKLIFPDSLFLYRWDREF